MKMTESDIQYYLLQYRKSSEPAPMIFPNVFHYSWESDMLYITRALYLYEYEIKLTRSDYYADKKKYYRHYCLENQEGCPKHFWYVSPNDVIAPDGLPEYAGLMYVSDSGLIRVVRQAPTLKSEKITQKKLIFLLNKITYRYWDKICYDRHNSVSNNKEVK